MKLVFLIPIICIILIQKNAAGEQSFIPDQNPLIVGGVESTPNEFPSIVNLGIRLSTGQQGLCGGSIINETWILTAAHCITTSSGRITAITVNAGDHNRNIIESTQQTISAVDWIAHPSYNYNTLANDIGLVRLGSRLNLTNYVRIIGLAVPTFPGQNGTNTVIAGWGTTYSGSNTASPVLRKANVTIITNTACSNRYALDGVRILDSMLCAQGQGRDTCQGDSGGPMYCANGVEGVVFVCGITSFGIGCADPSYPGVYTRVSSYGSWINSVLTGSGITTTTRPTTTTTTRPTTARNNSPKNKNNNNVVIMGIITIAFSSIHNILNLGK